MCRRTCPACARRGRRMPDSAEECADGGSPSSCSCQDRDRAGPFICDPRTTDFSDPARCGRRSRPTVRGARLPASPSASILTPCPRRGPRRRRACSPCAPRRTGFRHGSRRPPGLPRAAGREDRCRELPERRRRSSALWMSAGGALPNRTRRAAGSAWRRGEGPRATARASRSARTTPRYRIVIETLPSVMSGCDQRPTNE